MSSLTEQQRSVVQSSLLGLGPVVVKAGPGSGKTHTVVSTIQSHLSMGVPPEEVIAITFTRRAARELKERLGRVGRKVRASTIDSLALDITRTRFPELKTLSPVCSYLVFSVLCDLYHVKPSHQKFAYMDKLREAPYTGEDIQDEWKELEIIAGVYDQLLASSSYGDYLYTLLQAIWITRSGPSVRAKLVIVDEAQDTSLAQWELIKAIVAKTGAQLVIVGDMNQNIYSWRNAAPEVFQEYAVDDNSIPLPLKQCFRCQPKVIRASNALIEINPGAESDVVSMRDGVFHPVQVCQERPVMAVLGLLDQAYSPKEIAVLCRTNRTVQQVARELEEAGVIVNAVQSLEGKVGFLAMAGLFGADQHNTINHILLKESGKEVGLNIVGDDAESILASIIRAPHGFEIASYITQCGNKEIIFAEALALLDAIPELRQPAYELRQTVGPYFVEDAIERLLAPPEVEEASSAVTICTIHQAKGLEWPAVVIADLKAGTFPSKKSVKSEQGIIEERRLMYVAMTRAKDHLTLCADPFAPSEFVFPLEFYNAEEISGLGTQTIREAGW